MKLMIILCSILYDIYEYYDNNGKNNNDDDDDYEMAINKWMMREWMFAQSFYPKVCFFFIKTAASMQKKKNHFMWLFKWKKNKREITIKQIEIGSNDIW